MKKIKYKHFIAVAFLAALTGQCKKDSAPAPDNPYGLPNATQTGANVFACRINEENFISNNYSGTKKHVTAQLINDTLYIAGSPLNSNSNWTLLFVINKNIQEKKTYSVNTINATSTVITDSTACLGITFNIQQYSSFKGEIMIANFNSSEKIISGTFDCIVPIKNCDTLKITDGRFDIKYQ
jgi:hypothetical protein